MASEDLVELPAKLSKWFTYDDWKKMPYYERKRTLTVLENYLTLTKLGFNVPKPDFMYPLCKTSRAPTKKIPVSSASKVAECPKEKGQHPFRAECEVSAVRRKCHKPVTYKLRQRKTDKSYREDSSSDEDDYLYCDECNREWSGACPSHGPLIHVMDTQVPVYPLDPERASKTLPNIFRLGPSAIRKAGLGVWTTTTLLPHTVFGPYEGSLTDTANEEGYCWLVREKGRPSGFIDASNSSISNWMRFVNCSRHEKERNLVAFQYKKKIYYRTTRLIPPDVELLLWYGEGFGKVLGIDKKKFHVSEQYTGEAHRCFKCRLSFSSAAYCDRHLSYCRGRHIPSKVNCTTAIMFVGSNLSKNSRIGSDIVWRHDPKKNCASKTGSSMNQVFCNQSNRLQKDRQDLEENLPTTSITQPNVWDTCKDRVLSTQKELKITSESSNTSNTEQMEKSTFYKTCSRTSDDRTNDRNHRVERIYNCSICNKTLSNVQNLRRHERIHTGERPYKCNTCNKAFSQASVLRTHERIHTGERPYKCSKCNKAFTRGSYLHVHEQIHTGECPYRCTTCNKSFSYASSLHKHERIHTGVRLYKCTKCDKAFTYASELRTHERIHSGERPYKCSKCNKAFTRGPYLHAHERVHTGSRPYKCTTCNKTFSQYSNLHVHKRIHSRECPYKCTTCNKAFSQATHLRIHERIHTGEHPYKCTTCNKAFSQPSNLRKHERIHTGEHPYKCST